MIRHEKGMAGALTLFTALLSCIASMPAFAAAPTQPATTRKVVLEKSGAGYRWKLTEAAVPVVGDDQVLIRVHAIGLNRGDLDMLDAGPDEGREGRVPTSDAAGEVIAVGKNVRDVRRGARVTNTYFRNWVDGPFSSALLKGAHGWTTDGVLVEYLVLDSTEVAPIPDSLTYEEAATLPTAAVTAWNAVTGGREIHRGDVVLVQGTGGVSTFATQFAAALGARVIVTSSSDEKLVRAKALGARDGINYKTEPAWSARVLKLTNGHGADLVVDVGGKSTLDQSVKSLADAGTLSVVGGLSGYDGSISAWGLLMKAANAQAVFVGSRADYLRMTAFMVTHKLHPVIERVYALEQYEEAMKALASGNFVGKIVLRL